ncbi:MAG: SCO family protein [Candidatus Sumerlaeota bacterium]|nr:SCO family protein [Candidatus Sumerlaeota bacterium]
MFAVVLASMTVAWAFGPEPPTPNVSADALPLELQGVGVEEHLDGQLPLGLEFKDELNKTVKLGDYFRSGRPVLLTFNYYECPMLCTLQLNGLVDALRQMDWVPGREFEFVTISFNPAETPTLAKLKKQSYIKEYGKAEAAAGWHFLTGTPASIDAATEAAGFHYKWNEARREFAHVAAGMVCTPAGRLARYLYGVQYDPKTLRLSLVEAAEGKIGSPVDKVILYCFHFDPAKGRYGPAVMNLMRVGGGLTVLAVAIPLVVLWRRDYKRAKSARKETAP